MPRSAIPGTGSQRTPEGKDVDFCRRPGSFSGHFGRPLLVRLGIANLCDAADSDYYYYYYYHWAGFP